MSQYRIDGLRFRLQSNQKNWQSHPDMSMITLSMGKLRVLDTREGKNSIIVIPDGPNIIEHHLEIVQELRKSYRVILFDLPGFGFSTHRGNYNYSFSKTISLINELLDHIRVEATNLVFPCALGFYGLAFANEYPEKVKQLILLQTPSLDQMWNWTDHIVPGYLKVPYIGQLIMPIIEKKMADGWYDYALPKDVDRQPYKSIALEGIKKGGTFCLCSLSQGLLSENDDHLEIDSSIPTTLIYGDKDFTHRKTSFDSILKYNKKTDIIKFENCGHFPDLERSSQFIQIIKDRI